MLARTLQKNHAEMSKGSSAASSHHQAPPPVRSAILVDRLALSDLHFSAFASRRVWRTPGGEAAKAKNNNNNNNTKLKIKIKMQKNNTKKRRNW